MTNRSRRGLLGAAALAAAALLGCAAKPAGAPPDAVRLLIDREEVFPAVLAAIRGARREVLLSVYLLAGRDGAPGSSDAIGREIVDALAERQAAGVRVRVLNTRFVAVDDPWAATRTADDPWFHPVFDDARARGLPIREPAPERGIDHAKYLVVDGREAIFGGMNLADATASDHDAMLALAGPGARRLQELFAIAWRTSAARRGEPESPAPGELTTAATDDELAAARERRLGEGWSRCPVELRAGTAEGHDIAPRLLAVLASLGRGDRLDLALLLLNEPHLLDSVLAAHRRGVVVRVLLDPGEDFYGVDCRGSANAPAVARLAEVGVAVRYYDVRRGQELHLKAFVATRASGERILGIGSANWTAAGMFVNWEVSALLPDCVAPAERFAARFAADWNERSREIPPATLAAFRDPVALAALAAECQARLARRSWLRGRR